MSAVDWDEALRAKVFAVDGTLHWVATGRRVGTGTDRRGYVTFSFRMDGDRRTYRAHRIVWFLHHGAWPDGELDHINGKRADNRIENLRVVSRSMNARNMALRADNKSGAYGVFWKRSTRRWIAQITVEGRRRQIGSFDCRDAAVQARIAAEKANGFSSRHGAAR